VTAAVVPTRPDPIDARLVSLAAGGRRRGAPRERRGARVRPVPPVRERCGSAARRHAARLRSGRAAPRVPHSPGWLRSLAAAAPRRAASAAGSRSPTPTPKLHRTPPSAGPSEASSGWRGGEMKPRPGRGASCTPADTRHPTRASRPPCAEARRLFPFFFFPFPYACQRRARPHVPARRGLFVSRGYGPRRPPPRSATNARHPAGGAPWHRTLPAFLARPRVDTPRQDKFSRHREHFHGE
jgi:hypothetical protein